MALSIHGVCRICCTQIFFSFFIFAGDRVCACSYAIFKYKDVWFHERANKERRRRFVREMKPFSSYSLVLRWAEVQPPDDSTNNGAAKLTGKKRIEQEKKRKNLELGKQQSQIWMTCRK